jgi:hypothetical protein
MKGVMRDRVRDKEREKERKERRKKERKQKEGGWKEERCDIKKYICYIYRMLFSHSRKETPVTCNNMGEPREHYFK